MILQAIAFYVFSGLCLSSAIAVIAVRNSVRSVLFLILSFCSAAGLFILLGAEFLGLILIVVYVGAVAVLFLFVVMMLDIDFAELRSGMLNYLPVGALVGILLLIELFLVAAIGVTAGSEEAYTTSPANPMPSLNDVANTDAIGRILYTDYIFFFQIAGVILLVAMIGAIVLTLRPRSPRKGVPPGEQILRNPKSSIEVRDIKSNSGLGS